MTKNVVLSQDENGFLKKAAQIFMESSADAIEKRGLFTVALAGGSTPKKIYALLSDSYYRNRVNWTKTHVFWGDERMVPPNHPDSNYKMTNDNLLSRVAIPSVNVHRIAGEMSAAQEAARSYEQSMKVFFRAAAVDKPMAQFVTENSLGDFFPRFDLVLLGVGNDGHTASLFPGTSALTEKTRWVTGGRVEAVSAERVTLTFPVLNNARQLVFLCSGEGKSTILKEIFQGDDDARRFPAQLVRPTAGEVTWLLDKGAASRLPSAVRYKAAHIS